MMGFILLITIIVTILPVNSPPDNPFSHITLLLPSSNHDSDFIKSLSTLAPIIFFCLGLLTSVVLITVLITIRDKFISKNRNAPSSSLFHPLLSPEEGVLRAYADDNIFRRLQASRDTPSSVHTPNTYYSSIISIRILEEPLTAQNLSTIISSLTELHTKCWLIEQGRFADLITYTQTHDPRFSEEAPLVIEKITHNSPAWLQFLPNSQRIAEALKIAIDAIVQAPLRFQSQLLDNRAKAAKLELEKQKAALALKDKEHSNQVEAQKAEISLQKELLELEKEQLEIEKERFEFETKRFEYSLKAALLMVDTLRPGADEGTKAMLAQTIVPNLLQLGNGKGVELALPEPKDNKNVKATESYEEHIPPSEKENT